MIYASIILLAAFVLRYKKTGSLCLMLPIYYLFACSYTAVGSEWFSYATVVPFGFYEIVDEASVNDAYILVILAAVSFHLGASNLLPPVASVEGGGATNREARAIRVKGKVIYSLYALTIVAFHLGNGVSNVYLKHGYTIGESGGEHFRILFTLLLPLTALTLPFVRSRAQRYILLFLLVLMVQGANSRSTALIPALYIVGATIRSKRIGVVKFVSLSALSLVLAMMAFEYRNNAVQGVVGNLINLFVNGINFDLLIYAMNYLFSYSLFATALTLQQDSAGATALFASLNPLPSSIIDISSAAESHKLNEYAPYTAVGTIGQYGWLVTATLYFIFGGIFKIAVHVTKGGPLIRSLPVVMLLLIFTVISLQYNLRGSVRLVYYALVFILGFGLLSASRAYLRNSGVGKSGKENA